MMLAFIMGALTTGIITGILGYLYGSKLPDFQERTIAYAYEHRHKNCVYKNKKEAKK